MSSDLYTGNAAQTDFTITYPYLSRDFVKVYVDDVLQTHNVDYTYISPTVIRFAVAPPAVTDNVLIQRVTSTAPLVDFVNGSGINAADLDTATQQSLHASEEATGVVGPAGPTGPAGAGGTWTTLVATTAATPDSSEFSQSLLAVPGTADRVRVRLTNFRAATNDANLLLSVGTHPSIVTFAARDLDDYSYTLRQDQALGTDLALGTNLYGSWYIAADVSNSKISPSIEFILHLGRGNTPPALESWGVIAESGGGIPYAARVAGSGILDYPGPITAFHVYFNTGNIAEMDIKVEHDG